MKVRFLAQMPSVGYSGGRLMALTYANALALVNGVSVDFVTNNISVMENDFASFSKVNYIRASLDNLSRYADDDIDIVVLVPGLGNFSFHAEVVRHAIELNSKLVLLNFETPNWFNKVSPVKKDPHLWDGWLFAAQFCDLILSISQTGMLYAKKFYTSTKEACFHDYCYVPINSFYADLAPPLTRRKEILMISRVDGHKGMHALHFLADQSLCGYTFRLILGNGDLTSDLTGQLRAAYERVGMEFIIDGPLDAERKFIVMKRAAVLYFPTLFEGFGIPPLEANYCGLPVVCSDLEVLREYGEGIFSFFDPCSAVSALEAIQQSLSLNNKFHISFPNNHLKTNSTLIEGGLRTKNIFSKLIS